jgi:hypothetical protein
VKTSWRYELISKCVSDLPLPAPAGTAAADSSSTSLLTAALVPETFIS